MKGNFKNFTAKVWAFLFCTLSFCLFLGTAQAQTVTEFNAAGTTVEWTVPTGVTQITIEAWGAGGAGGFAGDQDRERPTGGGGGGAYAKSTVNVIPGSILNVTVGRGGENPNGTARDGENSTVKNGSTTLVSAEGGKSVDGKNNAQGAQGGQAANSIGTTKYSGGNGGNGDMGASSGAYSAGGGGGGAAGTEGDGGNGGNGEGFNSGGARGNAGAGDEMNSIAGDGGKGYYSIASTGSGEDGFNYGGGGGGSTGYIFGIINSNHAGGKGGNGYIRISYEEALQVSYVLNGATNPTFIPEGMINPGDPMSRVKPDTITKDNHTFEGWFYDAAFTQSVDWTANCTQTSNFILYAKWTLNQVTVYFNANGGDPIPSPKQITIGAAMSTVQPATNPTRTGYNFAGWFYDEALTNAVNWSTNCTATGNFTLYAKWESALAATFDKVKDVTCYGGADGEIKIYISNGVAPFTYTLTGTETRNNVSANLGDNAVENLAAGSYNITVKDNSGKVVPATPAQITINQPAEMTPVVLTSTTNPCATGITEIVINATGETGYTYTWSAPAGVIATPSGTGYSTLTLSDLGAATTFNYSVTATNAVGCTTTANGTFTMGAAQVEITAGIAELCDGESTSLTAHAENVASYEWSTGETTQLINTPADAAAGNNTYSVTITNTLGCTATDDITIVTHPAVETVAGTSYDICSGQGFNYTPSVSSTSLTYTWTIASNEGVTGVAAQSTPIEAPIAGTNLQNSSNEILTVVYEVTPWEGSCSGTPFNVTVNVKPSITNATTSFDIADVNITLYYGACDTLYNVPTPTYTTNYEGTLTLSNNVSSVNSGTILGRIAPGTYTIVWTLTDECGNPRSYTKKYIVNYPPCGTDLTAIDNDNNTYQTVRIGCECWTKSNLRTTTYSDGSDVAFARAYSSQAYPDTTANKANFGLLYTWYSAVNVAEGNDTAEPEVKTASGSGYPYVQGVCPEGWAIPSMAQYYNAVSTVANIDGMKSTDINKWLPEHAGTDESGFSAVGAGFYNAGLGFESLLGKTWFWSYDQNIHTAQSASIGYYCTEMLNEEQPKGMGFSVRCIKRDN